MKIRFAYTFKRSHAACILSLINYNVKLSCDVTADADAAAVAAAATVLMTSLVASVMT